MFSEALVEVELVERETDRKREELAATQQLQDSYKVGRGSHERGSHERGSHYHVSSSAGFLRGRAAGVGAVRHHDGRGQRCQADRTPPGSGGHAASVSARERGLWGHDLPPNKPLPLPQVEGRVCRVL